MLSSSTVQCEVAVMAFVAVLGIPWRDDPFSYPAEALIVPHSDVSDTCNSQQLDFRLIWCPLKLTNSLTN